jgi:hypothetical protein
MSVPKGQRAWLVARIERLGIPVTISEYMNAVLSEWIARGAPPVWKLEEHLPPFPYDEEKWERAARANPDLIFPQKNRPKQFK